MIFSKQVHKIASGKNPCLKATDKNTMKLFVFDSILKESKIELSPITRCIQTNKTYNHNQIFMLNDDYICFYSNDNFEIVKDKHD